MLKVYILILNFRMFELLLLLSIESYINYILSKCYANDWLIYSKWRKLSLETNSLKAKILEK